MRTVALGKVATLFSGGTPARSVPDFWTGEIPWVTGADIGDDESVRARVKITPQAVTNSATRLMPPGTVVLVTRTSVGKVGVLREPTAFSQDITGISPTDDVHERYLVHVLKATAPHLQAQARGATIKGVTRSVVENLPVFLPRLDEQRRIAAILDHADALRAKRRKILAHLDSMPMALLQALLLVREYPRYELGELMIEGPKNGLYRPSSDYGSGAPIVRIDSYKFGSPRLAASSLRRVRVPADHVADFELRRGDLLVNRVNSREHVGKTALVERLDEATIFESNIMRVRLDEARLLPAFAAAFMQTSDVRGQVAPMTKDAVNQSSINQQDVRSIRVPVPTMSEQREFVHRTTAVALRRTAFERLTERDDELFASLQSRAFRGEL